MPDPSYSDKAAREESKDLVKSDKKDLLASGLKAAFGLSIYLAPLAALVDFVIPNSAVKRIADLAAKLDSEMKELDARVDKDYLKTDAAAFMLSRWSNTL